jgi:hypothetical protein
MAAASFQIVNCSSGAWRCSQRVLGLFDCFSMTFKIKLTVILALAGCDCA